MLKHDCKANDTDIFSRRFSQPHRAPSPKSRLARPCQSKALSLTELASSSSRISMLTSPPDHGSWIPGKHHHLPATFGSVGVLMVSIGCKGLLLTRCITRKRVKVGRVEKPAEFYWKQAMDLICRTYGSKQIINSYKSTEPWNPSVSNYFLGLTLGSPFDVKASFWKLTKTHWDPWAYEWWNKYPALGSLYIFMSVLTARHFFPAE